jgi:hypothetical protein
MTALKGTRCFISTLVLLGAFQVVALCCLLNGVPSNLKESLSTISQSLSQKNVAKGFKIANETYFTNFYQ